MLKAKFRQIIAGKIVGGSVQPIDDITSTDLEFDIDRIRQITIGIDAQTDIEGIEAWVTFEGERIDNVDFDFEDRFAESLFETQSNFDALKQELHFAITEKNPGTQDWIGSYQLLSASIYKERGALHFWIKLIS